jgi:hypothetical protein
MNILLAAVVLLACISLKMNAQDTIITFEGSRIPIRDYYMNNELQQLEYTTEKGRSKIIDAEDVFSVKSKDSENILYQMDSARGAYLCVEDMKCYMKGVDEARESHGAIFATLGGLAVGSAAVIYASTSSAKINYFWTPVVPLVFCIGVSFTRPSIANIKKSYPEWSNNERFLAGYYDQSRKKRVKNAILSSLTGMAIAAAVSFAVK